MEFIISQVFYTYDKRWAFQRVGGHWNLYDSNGDFEREFRSFKSMIEYMEGGKKHES